MGADPYLWEVTMEIASFVELLGKAAVVVFSGIALLAAGMFFVDGKSKRSSAQVFPMNQHREEPTEHKRAA